MKLYFSPGACSLSPHIVLREVGAKFDLEQVNNREKKTKSGVDYWTINGKGQVPVLELDNGERLTEGPVIVQWIADRLAEDGYRIHKNLDRCHHVWRLSGKRLIAGMSYLGQWEERCLSVLEEARKRKGILWIEDLHLFGRLGQSRQSEHAIIHGDDRARLFSFFDLIQVFEDRIRVCLRNFGEGSQAAPDETIVFTAKQFDKILSVIGN